MSFGISLPSGQSKNTDATNDQCGFLHPDDLARDGIPGLKSATRLTYVGEFSSWNTADPAQYLAAFRIRLPKGTVNRHQVFSLQADKITIHVPALVLMRAFFRPTKYMLAAAFTPVDPDMLSFVNYAQDPPKVVADYSAYLPAASSEEIGECQDRALEWLQLSRSARASVTSAYRHGLEGELDLSLPAGQVRMRLHGLHKDGALYATKAILTLLRVPEEDSIIGRSQEFVFHAMADKYRLPGASVRGIHVPRHADGSVVTSNGEWESIEPILVREPSTWTHPPRLVLDTILRKLGQWHDVGSSREASSR